MSGEMNQSDTGPEGNEEVCSTSEMQHAEKNGYLSRATPLNAATNKIFRIKSVFVTLLLLIALHSREYSRCKSNHSAV